MKMNAPASPPTRRLPVLTEVVQLSEHEASGWPELSHDLPVPRDSTGKPLWGDGRVEEVLEAASSHEEPPGRPKVSQPPWGAGWAQPGPGGAHEESPGRPKVPHPPWGVGWTHPAPGGSLRPVPAPVQVPGMRGEPAFNRVPPVLVALPVASPTAEPQPVARAPAFASSWWADDSEPPAATPPRAQPAVPAPVAPAVTESQVVHRVLAALDRQLEAVYDHRVNELVAPVLARAAETLVRELRQELSDSLHDMVARAVAIELARHSKNPGTS